jgi:glycosyltransferase involved in cell wall biosynthesis
MPHGMLDPYFQKAKDRKIKAIRNWLFWKFIEKDIIRSANGILFTCEEELLLAQHTFTPYQPAKETVVGLGIPPTEISDLSDKAFFLKCPLALNQKYILFMGRIHIKKGVDLLIEAYEQILLSTKGQNGPTLPKLLIAGPGWNSDFGKQVQAAVDRSVIAKDNIIISDILGHDEKWGALRNCEAFILPSHQENYGIAIVEALSVGKPVLISDKINIWREIKNGNGGLVANDDVEGTKQNLSTWFAMSDPSKEIMSESAKSTFEQYFSLTKATEKLAAAL